MAECLARALAYLIFIHKYFLYDCYGMDIIPLKMNNEEFLQSAPFLFKNWGLG